MNEKVQKMLSDLTAQEQLDMFKGIIGSSDVSKAKAEDPTNLEYINKSACELAIKAGYGSYPTIYGNKSIFDVYKQNYVEVNKGIGDYTGTDAYLANLTTWNRNDKINALEAKEYWNMVIDRASSFVSGISFKTSDRLTYDIDSWINEEENLTDTLRLGRALTDDERRDQVGKIGYQLLAKRVEMQHQLKDIDITNNLYDPQFETKIINSIMTGFANDLLRLWTNGVSDDYANADPKIKDHMYRLGIGWTKILQDSNGSWINANKDSMVLGAGGEKHTAHKVRVKETGTVAKYAPTFATVDGFVSGGDATVSVSGGALVVTKGTTGTTAYARKMGIIVKPNTPGTLNITQTGGHSTSSAYIEIYDSKGNKLAETTPVVGVAVTAHVIPFPVLEYGYIELWLHQTVNSQAASFSSLTVTQDILETTGEDIIEIMNLLVKNMPLESKDKAKYEYCMSPEDVQKYAEAKQSHLTISAVTGAAVGINTTTRDMWVVEGIIPKHNGYNVTFNPFMDPVDDMVTRGTVAKYGSIIFQVRSYLYALGVNDIKTTREYKAQLPSGGDGVMTTKRMYTDAGTAPAGLFGIAFKGAKVETPVIMQDTKIKSTICATGVTTAVAGLVPYCDTRKARIFAVLTSGIAKVATLALAESNVGSGVYELKQGDTFKSTDGLTAASWSFVAFKTIGDVEILDRSDVLACTFA